jgi:hypothetical protein
MQRAAATLTSYLPRSLGGARGGASGAGFGDADEESKRYIALPTFSPAEGRSSSDSFTSQLSATRLIHPAGKRRLRLGLMVGGTVAVIMLLGAARHTYGSGGGGRLLGGASVYPTTEWEGLPQDRPERWGWTEEMGWMEHESSTYLGDVGESAYRLGFGKGMDGTEW